MRTTIWRFAQPWQLFALDHVKRRIELMYKQNCLTAGVEPKRGELRFCRLPSINHVVRFHAAAGTLPCRHCPGMPIPGSPEVPGRPAPIGRPGSGGAVSTGFCSTFFARSHPLRRAASPAYFSVARAFTKSVL
jgi:hypothetical protein